jgi:arsenate reductase (thioredoxin)
VKRVLFVCLGNSCRSQMAEGFARCYGRDVMHAQSAGLAPAASVAPDTVRTMAEKNIDLEGHFPKALTEFSPNEWDVIVNMSGFPLPSAYLPAVRHWTIQDPMGEDEDVYRRIRDQIEHLVMHLILEYRREEKSARPS